MHTLFFFFNDTATTEIYTLSLHDALPISPWPCCCRANLRPGSKSEIYWLQLGLAPAWSGGKHHLVQISGREHRDRKSTRLNSSHQIISYAVFCLKKKNTRTQ